MIGYSKGHPYKKSVVNKEGKCFFRDFIEAYRFDEIIEIEHKNGWDISAYYPCQFEGGERLKENAGLMSMVVIDVDNKPDMAHKLTPEEVKNRLKVIKGRNPNGPAPIMGLNFFMYSTHSNTAETPRFRVLLPCSSKVMHSLHWGAVSHNSHTGLYLYIRYLLDNHESIDPCSATVSQPFNSPCCSPANADIAFTDQYDRGINLSIWDIPSDAWDAIKNPERRVKRTKSTGSISFSSANEDALINQPMHRRERLLRIVCAEFHSGATEEQATDKIHQYDLKMHTDEHGGPHFEKKRYRGKDPYDAASEFVYSEYRILARKYDQEDFEDNQSIFADW